MKKDIKTSITHPIYVDFVEELEDAKGKVAGKIGLTIAPGKKQLGAWSGGSWDRDLPTDLAILKDTYRCTTLVTLLETFEMKMLKIEKLLEETAKAGLKSVWYPISDGGVPTDMTSFDAVVRPIVEACLKGEVVVVHCMGGLGRSGTVAACCLLHWGYEPKVAIALVRKYRKGAIENSAQVQFIHNYQVYIQKAHYTKRVLSPIWSWLRSEPISDWCSCNLEIDPTDFYLS